MKYTEIVEFLSRRRLRIKKFAGFLQEMCIRDRIFAVGTGSGGDVVVMSIGSHEIIVNDAKATIDAAPMIQNDRTFVPFRALRCV